MNIKENDYYETRNFGPINFVINKTKERTKIIGTTKNGFRSFAYLGSTGTSLADAKRSIFTDYNNRRMK
tara:strand:- start:2055 stop:2261 length:207 start_codon:yes stop_codon:yes gene_type:complete